jgi:uroporphyrinogen-III synthase
MLPLKDKTTLVTRSANQVEDFINQLEALGANTITLPLIENTAINQHDLTKKVAENNYDWIIFTSVNAVKFFFDTIPPDNITSKIAVVGKKTKAALKKYDIAVNFIPSEFTAKHLATEIPLEANQRILIPRSNLAKNDIVEILESKNCDIETISIYENNSIRYSSEKLEKIFSQKIDYISFTSGSIVQSFVDLGITLNETKVICIGPETAKIAKQMNLEVAAIANPHTIEGMVKAIESLC